MPSVLGVNPDVFKNQRKVQRNSSREFLSRSSIGNDRDDIGVTGTDMSLGNMNKGCK